ncbi:hypothetical protein [uncultured Desulfuromusa sp.]|uniref:hypothetical protein n=1 Tax=uncultured Desulfuromusa sp. TaxID=219183 RepID=UPI002AA8AD89|nr:hypothetical protein [uncultured Desulfuromusa sp.]
MTRGVAYLIFIFLLSATILSLLIASSTHPIDVSEKQQLVNLLGITDLSLSSEARYTRHPTQADVFAAFQDFPGAFEHFPTGSMIPPNPIGFSSRIHIQPFVEKQN